MLWSGQRVQGDEHTRYGKSRGRWAPFTAESPRDLPVACWTYRSLSGLIRPVVGPGALDQLTRNLQGLPGLSVFFSVVKAWYTSLFVHGPVRDQVFPLDLAQMVALEKTGTSVGTSSEKY